MQFNLSFSPAQTEFIATPGATFTQAYQILNNSQNTISLSTSIESWQPQGIDGSVAYLPNQNTGIEFSLNNADLKLGQNFNLRPNESRQLVLKVKIPQDAPLKDNYFTFFISKIGNNSQAELGSSISAKIGSHLLLSVANQENPPAQAKIESFTHSPQIKDVFLTPITFNSIIKNESDYFFRTFGQLSISKNNRTLSEIQLNPQNVLAHHSRQSTPINLNPPFWPGAYQATLSLDASASSASASTSFYVFPFSPLVLIALFAFLIWLIRRKQH